MMIRKTLAFAFAIAMLAACSKKVPDAPLASADAEPAAVTAAPVEAKLIKTRAFDCLTGGRLELKDYDDHTTRVDINGLTHTLTAVTVDGGALLQGDNISVRLFDDQATASENGIVLYAGCKTAP